jgi:hypothetical protein
MGLVFLRLEFPGETRHPFPGEETPFIVQTPEDRQRLPACAIPWPKVDRDARR